MQHQLQSSALHQKASNKTVLTLAAGVFLLASGFHPVLSKSLKIENRTEAKLNELTIVTKDGGEKKSYVLTRDLAPGAHTRAKLPRGVCMVDVHGSYDDKSLLDAEDLDLCQRHTLRLVQ